MKNTSLLTKTATARIKPIIRSYSGPIGSITGVKTHAPVIVMTFDDGPDPRGTEAILQALADFDATATFFVLLTRARRHPALLSAVAESGHEIGLHGIDHRRLTNLPVREVLRRTRDGKNELEDLTGAQVRWMRPPYGAQCVSTWAAIKACSLEPVMWSRTTSDSREASQDERVARATNGAVSGDILLAHDGFAGPADGVYDGPEPFVDRGGLAGRVLSRFEASGLAGRSLGAALAQGEFRRSVWFSRRRA
ncbi:polysaccharide deacetylase family protein [Arthrobacter sp. UYEF3]|uniref:polysaccharide deacetylase family protein n=1 Tax=Arthrobacter sp. UYEF3 TaxID=1756365 RepID=UPI00339888E9